MLLSELQQRAATDLQQAAALPADVCFQFDAAREAADSGGSPLAEAACGGVRKTACRTVVSLRHGRFQACETVRQAAGPAGRRSQQLATVVPRGARYGFDLIAHVGVETYVRGRSLHEVRE